MPFTDSDRNVWEESLITEPKVNAEILFGICRIKKFRAIIARSRIRIIKIS